MTGRYILTKGTYWQLIHLAPFAFPVTHDLPSLFDSCQSTTAAYVTHDAEGDLSAHPKIGTVFLGE